MPPALIHFCALHALCRSARAVPGAAWPRKMGLNWFIPALANSKVGSSRGMVDEEWT